MTYRERKEARAERLREWAEKRKAEATGTLNRDSERYRGDHAFNTQPGHIPERARVIARTDRAFESLNKAGKMESRAAGIEAQLDRSIYSDDPDAIEALESKLAELEAKRERKKAINKAYKKGDVLTLAGYGIDYDKLRAKLSQPDVLPWCKAPFPAYEIQNLGGVITNTRKRIEEVKARRQRAAAVDEAGGVLITEYDSFATCGKSVSVQFSEKPERSILDALRGAGFFWQGDRWHGPADKLPPVVRALVAADNDLGNAVDFDSEGVGR